MTTRQHLLLGKIPTPPSFPEPGQAVPPDKNLWSQFAILTLWRRQFDRAKTDVLAKSLRTMVIQNYVL